MGEGEYRYLFIQSEQSLWTVGYYDEGGGWHPESDHDSPEEAAKRVHYLNGGAEEINMDLLEACEAAYDWLNRFGESAPIQFGGEGELGHQLYTAITQARGEP
ncbi:MAG: hypothetical protein ACOC6F_02960 [bacterium]